MSIQRDMPDIDKALNESSWDWLQDTAPELASAIEAEAKRRTPPTTIYRYVLKRIGLHREPLALRCRQAAEHLQGSYE